MLQGDLARADAAHQVGGAGGEACPEHGVAGEPVHAPDGWVTRLPCHQPRAVFLDLPAQHDHDDQAVERHCLTEDHRDQVDAVLGTQYLAQQQN